MIKPVIERRKGDTIHCVERVVVLYDGCGTRTTVGYLLPEYGPIFRQMFDAAMAMLPEGSHFVSGARLNHEVLPNRNMPKAHSFMIDLNRSFLDEDVRYAQWIGEFYPAYDMVAFIEAVWTAARQKVETLVERQLLRPAVWPPGQIRVSQETNFSLLGSLV